MKKFMKPRDSQKLKRKIKEAKANKQIKKEECQILKNKKENNKINLEDKATKVNSEDCSGNILMEPKQISKLLNQILKKSG